MDMGDTAGTVEATVDTEEDTVDMGDTVEATVDTGDNGLYDFS